MVTETRQSRLAVRPSVCVPALQAVHCVEFARGAASVFALLYPQLCQYAYFCTCVEFARGALVSAGHTLHGGLPVLE